MVPICNLFRYRHIHFGDIHITYVDCFIMFNDCIFKLALNQPEWHIKDWIVGICSSSIPTIGPYFNLSWRQTDSRGKTNAFTLRTGGD